MKRKLLCMLSALFCILAIPNGSVHAEEQERYLIVKAKSQYGYVLEQNTIPSALLESHLETPRILESGDVVKLSAGQMDWEGSGARGTGLSDDAVITYVGRVEDLYETKLLTVSSVTYLYGETQVYFTDDAGGKYYYESLPLIRPYFVHKDFESYEAPVYPEYLQKGDEVLCAVHKYEDIYEYQSVALPLKAPRTWLKGEFTGDTVINASDAAVLLAYIAYAGAQGVDYTEETILRADANEDGEVNAADATVILQYSAFIGVGGAGTLPEYLAAQG